MTSDRPEIPVEQLHFPRQTFLSLQPLSEGQQPRYQVHLIGEESPISLIVSAPIVDGKLTSVREQQPFVARAFLGKDILAFHTRVLKAYFLPFPHLHLAWPTFVERVPIRKSARAEVAIPISLKQDTGDEVGAGMLVDLSSTGARITCAGPMVSVGTSVQLSFRMEMDDVAEGISFKAIVRSSKDMVRDPGKEDGSRCAIGLEFVNLSQEERMLLTAFVNHNLLKLHG